MIFWKPFKKLYKSIYIKLDILVSKFIPQGNNKKTQKLYKLWSHVYDFGIKIDKNYLSGLHEMIDKVVFKDNEVLDIGCGTGFASIYAAKKAKSVIGIDLSLNMIKKLKQKIERGNIGNISIITGSFPEVAQNLNQFDSVISSHTFVHFTPQQRKDNYKVIFGLLKNGGKIGLFTSQGEIAPMFEKRDELTKNLNETGFQKIEVEQYPDMYWIITAEKP